jgi:nucleoside-diphosphate-sugar epimerase
MIQIEGRKIAIIGGAGFIGHNLALTLTKRGAAVQVVDSLQVNNLLSFQSNMSDLHNRELYLSIIHERLDLLYEANVPLHIQDARDYHALGKLLEKIGPDVIIHLAAVAHAGRANKDPSSTFDHSLRTLENALDFARFGKVAQFVYLSSSMVYGDFGVAEVDEEHPLNPIGIYGALKLAGEKLVIAYNQVFDLPYTIIRPSALYGPRCVSRRVGQVFIENALEDAKLRIDGDGSERLDFTYIEDLVDGICATIEHPAALENVFNLTYGSSRPIIDLVEILRNYFPDLKTEFQVRDKLMPIRGTLSVRKARELLDYAPQNPVEVGFRKYVEWYLTSGRGHSEPNKPLAHRSPGELQE